MTTATAAAPVPPPALGLKQNWRQFSLLVLISAFVGGMVGLERAILPLVAEREFGLASKSVILSFIVTFGIVKAVTNLAAGVGADAVGRKPLLVGGWLAGIPVPFLLMWAPTWGWITAANVLLGINQGLCWSTAVVMKIDLIGPRQRGLATGLNEFAGYVAVGLAAVASAFLAEMYGLRPVPFILGVAFALLGLVCSLVFVRDTTPHAREEARRHRPGESRSPRFLEVLARGTFKDPHLFACGQAGLVNNLNDGAAWGLFPLFFAAAGLDLHQIGILAATYPAVWGVTQIGTGALSDRWGRKWLVAVGMWVQAAALWLIVAAARTDARFATAMSGSVVLGLGTALVYPTLLAAVGDAVHPVWRASAVGVYRLWRDLGYAMGALVSGVIADGLGMEWAIGLIAALTFGSGVVAARQMREAIV